MPDSGFLFCSDDGASLNATVLTRTSKWGEVIWSKRYQYNHPGGHQLIRFSENRYAIFTGSEITRIDSLGNIIWNIELDTSFWYAAAAKNDALVLHGLVSRSGTEKMMSVAKIDSSGTLLWSTCVDSLITNGIDALTTVPLADGSEVYFLLGTCYNEYNNYEAVTCISESGVLLWNHLYMPWLGTMRVCTTADSCALLAGYTGFDSLGGSGVYLLKLKPDGTVVYSKSVGPFNFSWPNVTCDAEKILLTGYVSWPQQGRLFSICLDTTLGFLWQREIYGTTPNVFYSVYDKPVICSDGGYALITVRQPVSNGPNELCLVKGDQSGNAFCSELNTNYSVVDIACTWVTDSIQYPFPVMATSTTITTSVFDVNNTPVCTTVDVLERSDPLGIVVGPNPGDDFINVQVPIQTGQKNEVLMFNMQGEQVACFTTYGTDFRIDISELPAATYTLSLNGEICSGKIVVIH